MSFSKNIKSSLAYAKIGKNMEKQMNRFSHSRESGDHQKQNQDSYSIYDTILGSLDIQDSNYIMKLISNNQEKEEKKTTQMNKSSYSKSFENIFLESESSLKIEESNHQHNQNTIVSSICQKPISNMKNMNMKKYQNRFANQISKFNNNNLQFEKQEAIKSPNFLDEIDGYIMDLGCDENKGRIRQKNNNKSNTYSRKTVQLNQTMNRQQQFIDYEPKYRRVKSQLRKIYKFTQKLESNLFIKTFQVKQIKIMIKELYKQMKNINLQLIKEKDKKKTIIFMYNQQEYKYKQRKSQKQKQIHKFSHPKIYFYSRETQSLQNENFMKNNVSIEENVYFKGNWNSKLLKNKQIDLRRRLKRKKRNMMAKDCLNLLQKQCISSISSFE